MILQFKTPRNTNGHRHYLAIDTDKKTFTTFDPHMITEGIEIKTSDYRETVKRIKAAGFEEKERI